MVAQEIKTASLAAVSPALPGPYTEGIRQVQAAESATVDGPGAVPLWSVGERPGAVLLRRGKGWIVVLADPAMLANQGLARRDNAVLLVNVARLAARAAGG